MAYAPATQTTLDPETLIEYIVMRIEDDEIAFDRDEYGIDATADPFEVELVEFTQPEGVLPRRFRARISVEITELLQVQDPPASAGE